MILTGNEIKRQVKMGNITIQPFTEKDVNPNSYNYRLGEEYTIVSPNIDLIVNSNFETKKEKLKKIPRDGLLLEPGKAYLANTLEIIGSNKFVTSLIGRSSLGRLGLFLQISADLGNLGPPHKWTLEMTCVQPIIVYPYMKIGQVSFWVPEGEIKEYKGEYTNYNSPKHTIYKRFFEGEL